LNGRVKGKQNLLTSKRKVLLGRTVTGKGEKVTAPVRFFWSKKGKGKVGNSRRGMSVQKGLCIVEAIQKERRGKAWTYPGSKKKKLDVGEKGKTKAKLTCLAQRKVVFALKSGEGRQGVGYLRRNGGGGWQGS